MASNFLKKAALEYGGAAVAAADNTDSNSTRFDMQGYESIIAFTTITDSVATGVATLKIEENSADSDTGMTAISGASHAATCAVNDDLNGKILAVEVVKPMERYVQAVRTSVTANIAFGEVYVIRIPAKKQPVSTASTAASAPTVVAGS